MLVGNAILKAAVLASSLASLAFASKCHKGNFTYNDREFLLNGKPYQMIGGQMDPQRIPREYWRQRLQMAKAMGLNTIFSYIFWNNLEPSPGQWDFEGRNDLVHFFMLAREEGLHAVLRPGPYICGEHEWGGFPAWLSQVPGMAVRQNNGPFLDASKKYLDRLGKELRRLQVTRGGPILMTQLENEYGSFGTDKVYLEAMAAILRDNFDVFLYTNDGGGKSYLDGGQLHGVLAEVDGSPKSAFEARDKYVTDPTSLGPLLNGEYYVTWIDAWSSTYPHQITSGDAAVTKTVLDDVDFMLAGNNSFSLYMFHGGTNWGFDNGGIWNADGYLLAVTSSYDYGAPLDESGRPTEIYHQLREVISKYVPKGTIPDIPEAPPLAEVPDFELQPVSRMLDIQAKTPTAKGEYAVTMDALGQSYGFVLYEHTATEAVNGKVSPGDAPRDRVLVYVNGVRVGIIDVTYAQRQSVMVSLEKGDVLQLLVENLGRVDYGQQLKEQEKGVRGNITINDTILTGWTMYSLPLDDVTAKSVTGHGNEVAAVKVKVQDGDQPVFYTGSFQLAKGVSTDLSGDTFLSLPAGVKGVVWVNGVKLGRYWRVGSQQSLYVPGCYLKGEGASNEVVVLELEPEADVELIARGVAIREWFNQADLDAA